MKIYYVAPMGSRFPSKSANSIHIMNISSSIVSLDHEVTLVCAKTKYSLDDIFSHYGQGKTFKISRIPVMRIKGFSLVYSLLAAFLTRIRKPHFVVSRDAVASYFMSVLGLPLVLDSHNPLWSGSPYEKLSYRFLRRSKNLKKMTFNSHALFSLYKKAGQLPDFAELEVAHNGARPSSTTEKINKWPGREAHVQVGYLGHLYKGRGVDIVLACAKAVPHFDFHIIGGDEKDILYWKSKTLCVNVFFHGYVSPSLVYRYRNTCDILLAPYQSKGVFSGGGTEDSSQYMNPIKLIEYLSSQRAIIASDLPPIREVVDESCGILVNPSDVDEWVEALLTLDDSSKRQSLGESGYKKFLSNLTWEARAKKLITVNCRDSNSF